MFSTSALLIGLSYMGAENVFSFCSKNFRRLEVGFNEPAVTIIVASPSFQTLIAFMIISVIVSLKSSMRSARWPGKKPCALH